ncbi:MAG: ATP synthase F0 subunit B [Oscillospiraceae bacterium]|nr:ATP synthase F0 subunit B [Oscillospiraceae bacterium]
MSINISEVIWTVICFFALLLVLKTFLFGPLIRHMDERQRRIDAGLAEARRADEAKSQARQMAEESWRQRSEEAHAAVNEGRMQDEKHRARELEDAQAQSAEDLRKARADTEREEEEARGTVSRNSADLARELADHLLSDREEGCV